jgi:hypothetical protein
VPIIDVESSCFLTVGEKSNIAVTVFENYEGVSTDGVMDDFATKNFVTLSDQRKINNVTNLVFNTCTRLLGRITKGPLVDVEQEYIGSYWVAWS